MRAHILLATGVLIYAAGSVVVCIFVNSSPPAGMPGLTRRAFQALLRRLLGAHPRTSLGGSRGR